MFESQIDIAPSDRQPLFEIYLNIYNTRSEELKEEIKKAKEHVPTEEDEFYVREDVSIIDDTFDFLEKGIVFDESYPEFDWAIPEEQALRPFFFMRLIQKTIQEGGFITDLLYVPRAVWEQTHAQIYAIERKITFFNDFKKEMLTLSIHKKKGTLSKDFKQVETLVAFVLKMQREMQ